MYSSQFPQLLHTLLPYVIPLELQAGALTAGQASPWSQEPRTIKSKKNISVVKYFGKTKDLQKSFTNSYV